MNKIDHYIHDSLKAGMSEALSNLAQSQGRVSEANAHATRAEMLRRSNMTLLTEMTEVEKMQVALIVNPDDNAKAEEYYRDLCELVRSQAELARLN